MAFFYNLLVTVAFVICALLFLLVYRQQGKRVHLWVAVMFALFVLDNLLLYMDELMPGFAVFAREHRSVYLIASNISGLLITFAYERIARYDRNEGPHPVVWPFWLVCAVLYIVLGVFGEQRWAEIATLIVRGTLPIVLIVLALRHGEGDYPEPVLGQRIIPALLVFQVLNFAEMALVSVGIQAIPGRFVTIEATSIACIVWGVWYCMRMMGEGAATPAAPMAGDAVASVSARYALTVREREILALLYEGCTNQEIAECLFISEGTVKTHVHNIFKKTDSGNRVQLLRLVADAEHRA